MARAIKLLVVLILMNISGANFAEAGVFDQKDGQTPKWSRVYLRFGRATGNYGDEAKSLSLSSVGYKQMRGQFGYGAEYSYLFADGTKIETQSVVMSMRPDWNLEAEPSLFVSYGLANASSPIVSKEGKGSAFTVGLSLDLFKGPFYSTSLGFQNTSLKTDAPTAPNSSFQTVTFSVNVDLY